MSTLREITKLNGRRKVRVNVRYTIPESRSRDCMDCSLVFQCDGFKVFVTYDVKGQNRCLTVITEDGNVKDYIRNFTVFGIGGYQFDDLCFGSGEVGITLYLDQLMRSINDMFKSKLLSVDLLMKIFSDKGNYGEDEKASVKIEVNSGCENFSESSRFFTLENSDTIASYRVFDTEKNGERWFTTDYPVELDPAITT